MLVRCGGQNIRGVVIDLYSASGLQIEIVLTTMKNNMGLCLVLTWINFQVVYYLVTHHIVSRLGRIVLDTRVRGVGS